MGEPASQGAVTEEGPAAAVDRPPDCWEMGCAREGGTVAAAEEGPSLRGRGGAQSAPPLSRFDTLFDVGVIQGT